MKTITKMNKEEIRAKLDKFTGGIPTRIPMCLDLSEGALWIAENLDAWWLMDWITVSNNMEPKIIKARKTGLNGNPLSGHVIIYKIKVANNKGVIRIEDGDYNLIMEEIFWYLDFPLDELTLWAMNDTILLPREY